MASTWDMVFLPDVASRVSVLARLHRGKRIGLGSSISLHRRSLRTQGPIRRGLAVLRWRWLLLTNESRWLWVPAFAGTTPVGRCSPSSPSPGGAFQGRVSVALANRHPAPNRAVQHLRELLDAVGGGVQRIGHRGLRRPGAIRRRRADAAQALKLLFEAADAMAGIEQFVAHRQRRHHDQPRVADLAELAAQILDPRFKALGELQEPRLLPFLARHPELPAVDGDVDMIHQVSPASSTERMVPIAASCRSAISRLVRSSLRDFTSEIAE